MMEYDDSRVLLIYFLMFDYSAFDSNNNRGVQARVKNQVYPRRQAHDPRYQLRGQIFTEYYKIMCKYTHNTQIHVESTWEINAKRLGGGIRV